MHSLCSDLYQLFIVIIPAVLIAFLESRQRINENATPYSYHSHFQPEGGKAAYVNSLKK